MRKLLENFLRILWEQSIRFWLVLARPDSELEKQHMQDHHQHYEIIPFL